MPIRKISVEVNPSVRFDWKKSDKFIVANFDSNSTIAHFVGEELFEIVGTEKDPVTFAELQEVGVDVDALYMAGQLGVFKDNDYVFYKESYDNYDDDYYEEPSNNRGFSFNNNSLDIARRQTEAQNEKRQNVDPNAIPVKEDALSALKQQYAN